MTVDESWKLMARGDALRLRARIIQAIRSFFVDRDYLEVETPLWIPAPAPEAHIDAVAAGAWFLQTSPELCMKRLLAAGYSRIFQICKCFREGERGDRHLPEFTMVEWYRAQADYRMLMEECEALLHAVADDIGLDGSIAWQGRRICLKTPWERISVRDAFARYAPVSAAEALRTDRFDDLLTSAVEPHLGIETPVFLYDYPLELGALARVKQEDPAVAERFELYVGGLELANAFSELTDAEEQRRRFEAVLRDRRRTGNRLSPMPERFLQVLPRMVPSAGIALGVDRLVMLLADEPRIDEVVTFTPESL